MPRSPRRTVLLVLLAPLLVGAAGAQAPTSFLESLEVRVVNMEVYVTDRQGNPVEGLSEREFTVLEDGKKQRLTNFSYVPAGADASEGGERGDAPDEPAAESSDEAATA